MKGDWFISNKSFINLDQTQSLATIKTEIFHIALNIHHKLIHSLILPLPIWIFFFLFFTLKKYNFWTFIIENLRLKSCSLFLKLWTFFLKTQAKPLGLKSLNLFYTNATKYICFWPLEYLMHQILNLLFIYLFPLLKFSFKRSHL